MFEKRFSVGLNLSEDMERLSKFFEHYKKYLNSVYFSLPLGARFYSRVQLESEYSGAEQKLNEVANLLQQLGIRREITINTYHLTEDDLKAAKEYCDVNGFEPEEIVCLEKYGVRLRELFPGSELKYSFNNRQKKPSEMPQYFDTIVVGKEYLRNAQMRADLVNLGYGVTLLLNNGCSYYCKDICDDIKCEKMFGEMFKMHSLEYWYALLSFFPNELKQIIDTDQNASVYKFKISNRPLGINYTRKVLDAYLSLESPIKQIEKDWKNYGLFCAVSQMARHFHELNLEEVMEEKSKLGV